MIAPVGSYSSGFDHRQIYADTLEAFGDRLAIVTEGGERITYAALAARADAFAAQLGPERRLLAIECSNDLPVLEAVIGALRHGHPVLLTASGDAAKSRAIFDVYAPDAVFACEDGAWRLKLIERQPKALHPDLALLLSTSGTTGSAKLVRLSHEALAANAAAIVEYLGISADDVAITSLPLHYSYGLSVIASHLTVGACIALTDRSVTEPEFWALLKAEGVTSLAGVPHTYDLLDRLRFEEMDLPSLVTLTQAGGRLRPDLALRYAAWAAARNARFFVMYGQTEATARMAYVPPHKLAANPGVIGVPIPGGRFRLVDEHGAEVLQADTPGELIYAGANVMMGYANEPTDLAKGPELNELATGDLACRDASGLYRIVGRKSRFSKLFGLRISLDEMERTLHAQGLSVHVAGDDDLIAIAGPALPPDLADRLGDIYGMPAACFAILDLGDPPLLASGKIDYKGLLASGKASAQAAGAEALSVERSFKRAFPAATLKNSDSFASLGGDSLSYVTLSLDLEQKLGFLPPGWEESSIAALSQLAPRRHVDRRWWRPQWFQSELLLRTFAIIAIIIVHASSIPAGGGAEALLMLVGFNMARYQRDLLVSGKGWRIIVTLAQRILLPFYVILLAYLAAEQSFDIPSILMVSNFFGRFGSFIEPFWFVEALLQCTVLMVVVFAIPAVRRATRVNPWVTGLVLLAAFAALKIVAFRIFSHSELMDRTPDAILYLFGLGWCAQLSRTLSQKLVVSAITLVVVALTLQGVPGCWDTPPGTASVTRALWLAISVGVLLWTPRVLLPNILGRCAATIAAASFYIYLTHGLPVHYLVWVWHFDYLPLAIASSLALGVLAWKASDGIALAVSGSSLWLRARLRGSRFG